MNGFVLVVVPRIGEALFSDLVKFDPNHVGTGVHVGWNDKCRLMQLIFIDIVGSVDQNNCQAHDLVRNWRKVENVFVDFCIYGI